MAIVTPVSNQIFGLSFRGWVRTLLLALAMGGILGWWWTGLEANRQEESLYSHEAQIVDSRAASVSTWVADQRRSITSVAANPAVGVYVMSQTTGDKEAALGQAGYLKNLIQNVAERDGWLSGDSQVPANVVRDNSAGLAILGPQGSVLAGAGGPLPSALDMITGKLAVNGTMRLAQGGVLRILMPINSPGGGDIIGYVYGVRLLDDGFNRLLAQPGEPQGEAEQAIVAKTPQGVLAVTGRAGVAGGELTVHDPILEPAIETKATQNASLANGTHMLVTVRSIANAGWSLVRLRPADAVLGAVHEARVLKLATWLFGLGLAGTGALLSWRHGAAVQAIQTAEKEARQREFLTTVSDRQPTAITVISKDGLTKFSNVTARRWAGSGTEEPALAAVYGAAAPAVQGQLAKLATAPAASTDDVAANGNQRIRIETCRLDPTNANSDRLVVGEDLTALIQERERREANLRALVNTLTGLVDARDPGSAHHSEKVSLTARAVGQSLGWTVTDTNTVYTAGLLMNIGKILVPSSILTKQGPLSADEHAAVRTAMAQTGALLANVPFDGPVAATIAAVSTPPTGPAGRLPRLLKLSNAFVSMVSPRAHRSAMNVDDAFAELKKIPDAEEHTAINALEHWLNHDGGKTILGLHTEAS